MPTTQPPYALAPTSFRFPALAALAGRSAIGGDREVALAVYLAARLADDCRPERGLSEEMRIDRAIAAKTWLSTLTLPAVVRPTIIRLFDASAAKAADRMAGEALNAVLAATGNLLDLRARAELERLAGSLVAAAAGVV